MKGKKTQRISQCMIVKNEEANLKQALSWGKGWLWEQIVVDTGSSDHTVEIAREMGAKVFFFPWTDDFSAAKNFAIEQAGGDWIAFLDADEYLAPGQENILSSLVEKFKNQADGISAGLLNLDEVGKVISAGTQVRFFKRHPDLRYRRRIHEQLAFSDGKKLRLADGGKELTIFHTGYSGKAMEQKAAEGRNQKLLRLELSEHPEDYELMGYMGDEYDVLGNQKEAEKWYRQAAARMPEKIEYTDQRSASTLTRLMCLMADQNREEELIQLYGRGIGILPQEPDFAYVAGRYYASGGNYEKGISYLENALGKLEKFGFYNKAMLLGAHLAEAYETLAMCCLKAEKPQKCVQYGMAALQSEPMALGVLCTVLDCIRKYEGDGQAEAAAGLLSRIYNFSSMKNRLFCCKAAMRIGWDGLFQVLEKSLTEEEKCGLEALRKERTE